MAVDNFTLTLMGLAVALGRPGRGLPRRLALVTAVIAANLPDVDLLVFLIRGQTEFVFRHATVTHSVFALAVLPLGVGAIAWLFTRASFPRLAGLSLLCVAGHLGLDALGAWGIAPLAPILDVRLGLGWLYSTDFVLLGLFSLPLWAPRVAGVAQDRVATLAMALAACWVAVMGGLHALAEGRTRAAAAAAGLEPRDVEVFASPFLPLFWNGLASDGEHLAQVRVTLAGASEVGALHHVNMLHPAVQAALGTEVGARWMRWARVPAAQVVCLTDPVGDAPGKVAVRLSDRRFADPWMESPAGTLRFELEYDRRGRPFRVLGHAWATAWTGTGDPEPGGCKDAPTAARR